MRDALLDALAVLFPVQCAGCGAPDRAVCAACRGSLGPPVDSRTPGGLAVRSGFRYEGVGRQIILALKESNRTDVVRALRPVVPAIDGEVVAVPTSREAWARRGYDPVRLLFRTGRPALRVVRSGAQQKALDVAARAENRAGAFAALRSMAGRRVTLVDDVLTSGATLDDAARALRAAGATVESAVTLAATPRYFGRSQ